MASHFFPLHWAAARLAGLGCLSALAWLGSPTAAQALACGGVKHMVCVGAAKQYAGGFDPGVGFGGFGGGDCKATRTPVIFIHGNADSAISWDAPPGQVAGFARAPRSVYAEMKARGYNDCELFGVTYLSEEERKLDNVKGNYHQPAKYRIIHEFIRAVQAYTGAPQVDIVAHSLGVSQTLATLHHYRSGGAVRRFVNIAGGLRGLDSCRLTGHANPKAPTCGSQHFFDSYTFGFHPEGFSGFFWVRNRWMGASGDKSLRRAPQQYRATRFYTIGAGRKDQVACASTARRATCHQTSMFEPAANVLAQLDVGAGADAAKVDLDWTDRSPLNVMGGDSTQGVGHFRARDNTGTIIHRMLQTDCSGLACAADYRYGPVALY